MRAAEWLGRGFGGAAREPQKVLIVNGEGAPETGQFCSALCDAYEAGVRSGRGDPSRLNTGLLAFGDGRFADAGPVESAIARIHWADQLMIVFPLYDDRPPPNLVALFELARYREGVFTLHAQSRTVITMEMPAFAYRAALDNNAGPHIRHFSLPGLEGNRPVMIGNIGAISCSSRAAWLGNLRDWGAADCVTPRQPMFAMSNGTVLKRN